MASFKKRVLPLILTTGIALGIIGGSFLGKKARPEKSTVTTYCQNDDSYQEEEIKGTFTDGVYLKICTPYLETEDGYVRTVTTYKFKDVSLSDLSEYLKLDASFYKKNNNPSFEPHQSNPSFGPYRTNHGVEYKDKLEEDKLAKIFALISEASIILVVSYELCVFLFHLDDYTPLDYASKELNQIPISIITSIWALKDRNKAKLELEIIEDRDEGRTRTLYR